MHKQLLEQARTMMQRAYHPYSGFPVGAALLSTSGQVYTGCNVENASFPEGTCAEAGAIAAMVAAGEHQIQALYVMGQGPALVSPCGGCRQRIREFAQPDTPVHICNPQGIQLTVTMADLLPHSFGPENLPVTERKHD